MTQQAPQQPVDELSSLAQSIVQDQRRIATMQNPTPGALAAEISGTLLAYNRDIAGYLARFEQSVISNFTAVFEAIGELQVNGGSPDEEEQTTQFEADDAAKFTDFIEGAKVLLLATKDAPGAVESVKKQIEAMLVVADELLQLVSENTLVEDGEGDEEGPPGGVVS